MRVEILKSGAGPAGVREVKSIHEVSDEEGEALIADKAARKLPDEKPATAPLPAEVEEPETEEEKEAIREVATAPKAPERAVTGKPRRTVRKK